MMAAWAGCKFEAVVHRLACCAGSGAARPAKLHGRASMRRLGAAAMMAAGMECKARSVLHRLAGRARLPAIRPPQRHGTAKMRAIQRGCHNGRLRGTQSCPAPLDLQRRFSWTTADLGVTAEHKCPPSNVRTYNHRRKTALSSQRDAT